ncbi:MAG TPA: 2-isopropylmalate synthase, partial [Sorangium sp.]|nr:2-isopropylmalate synthase [Sorangium sp.]
MTSAAPVNQQDLIFDWNELGRKGRVIAPGISFFDETLRDGLQNPSVDDPSVEEKIELLHLMADVGIHVANVGLPGVSERAFEDVLCMCKEIANNKLPLKVACAGRTVVADLTPIVEISQRVGIPIEIYTFIGSSPIRQYTENWDLDIILKRSAD